MATTKYRGVVSQPYQPEYRYFGNLTRMWFPSQMVAWKGANFGSLTFSPNWKGYPHPVNGVGQGDMDEHLRRMSARGIKVMLAMANGFNEQFSVPLKALPKDSPTLDKTKIESYSIFRKIIKQTALRYGSVQNDSLIDIAPIVNGKPQVPKSGQNTVTYIQLWNELNPYNGKAANIESLSGKQYAPLYDQFCEDIWEIDPNMRIVSAPTARFDMTWLDDFFTNSVHIHDPNNQTDISINVYLFGACGYDSSGVRKCNAIKPEDSPLFEQVNTWAKDRGLNYFITEHGCNSEKLYDLGYPDYGLDKFQSQAKFIIDSTNRWLSMSNCVGATFYQLTDDPNEPRFSETGVLDKDSTTDPTPKPSYLIVKADFDKPFEPSEKVAKIEVVDNPKIKVE